MNYSSKNLRYFGNVCISGLTAAGKSTHSHLLTGEFGLTYVSGSQIQLNFMGVSPIQTKDFWITPEAKKLWDADQFRKIDAELLRLESAAEGFVFDTSTMPWRHKEQALCIWLESTLESRVIKSIVSHRGREQFSHSEYTDKIAEKDRATIELYRSLYERGYFTNPRCRKSPEEVGSDLDQVWSHLEVVKVDPLRTQAQVRKLIDAHAYLVHRPNVDEAIDPEIESLVEWVDLASFIIKTPMENEDSGEGRRRELYGHILDC